MKLIVLLSCLSLVQAEVNPEEFVVNGVQHYRETLFENLPESSSVNYYYYSSVAVDYSSNILYFASYDNIEHAPAKFDLSTMKLSNTTDMPIILQSITVDQETQNIYLGTENGVYVRNKTTGETKLFGAQGVDIWRVYFDGFLYYSSYKKRYINTLVDGKSTTFAEVNNNVQNFVIDNEGNVVYVSYTNKLYTHKKGARHDILYEKIPAVRSMATDIYGNVYVTLNDGIYAVKNDTTVKKVVSIDNLREVAFDNNNNIIYYSVTDAKLYRLKPIVETISTTEPANSNIAATNYNYSDQQTNNPEPVVTSNIDIETQLQTINKKLSNLTEIINKLVKQ